jgi:hypothetical protein
MIKSNHLVTAGVVVLSLGTFGSATCLAQHVNPVVIEAPAPLEPVAEYHRILEEMEREFRGHSVRTPVRVDTLEISALPTARKIPGTADHVPALIQTKTSLKSLVLLEGLEPGVYTMWWVANGSAEWGSGAVVRSDGLGLFNAEFADPSVETHLMTDDVRLVIKYSGTAETGVDALSRQLTSLPPECADRPELREETHLTTCGTVRYLHMRPWSHPEADPVITQVRSDRDESDTSH